MIDVHLLLTLIFISLLIFADWSSVICYYWLIVWIIIRACFALIANYSWPNNDCLSLKSIIKGYHLFVINDSCSLTDCHWLIIIHYVSKNQLSLIDYPGLIVIGWFSLINHPILFISDELSILIITDWLSRLSLIVCHWLTEYRWLFIVRWWSQTAYHWSIMFDQFYLIDCRWSIRCDLVF